MTSQFTFLTHTDPALGRANTKRMRAHVTRKNFEKRRERLEDARCGNKVLRIKPQLTETGISEPELSAMKCRALNPYMGLVESDYVVIHQLFRYFRPLLLSLASDKATLLRERSWIQLNFSEPALLEASLAWGGLYHALTSSGSVTNADVHQAKAINMINTRLNDPVTAVTDGVLGAVYTLAYCERLAKRETGFETHMTGFRHMIQFRRGQNNQYDDLSWFSELLISDIDMNSQASTKALHSFFPDSISRTLDAISKDIANLRTAIEYSRRYELADHFLIKEIDERILTIQNKSDTLRGKLQYIDALAQSIRIFLHLSCDRLPILPANLTTLTSGLKNILSEPDTRLCSSFEFTIWQLFVGSVASTADSDTGIWFRTTLWRLARAFVLREWSRVLSILGRAFMPPYQLLADFKSVWIEVMENQSFHV
ncbi:hypothetical protein TMatcc_007697 [Talaromyces marneffei ATCC 18224]